MEIFNSISKKELRENLASFQLFDPGTSYKRYHNYIYINSIIFRYERRGY